MNGQMFDALTRVLAIKGARRQVAKGFLGGILATLVPPLQRPVTLAEVSLPRLTTESPPTIVSGPTVWNVIPTTVAVDWLTDQWAVGSVEYGLTRTLGRLRPREPGEPTTKHQVVLDNLEPNTTYYWRMRSTNDYGQVTTNIATFTTAKTEPSGGDNTPEQVVAEVVAALAAHDFTALGELHFPGWEPATWSDAWPTSTDFEPDFTGCVGADYHMDSWAWSPARACPPTTLSTDVYVLVSFDLPACGRGTTDDSSFTISTLTLRLLRGSDGWHLARIYEFNGEVPDDEISCINKSTGRLPGYYVGTWSGRGWQNNPDTTWPIVMSLTADPIGSVVGTSSYPSLGCEGQLVLTSIYSGYVPNVTLEETITVGRDNCIDGTFTLTSAESGQFIPFTWTSADGSTDASGSFVRNTIGFGTKTSLEIHASLCPAGYDGSDVFGTCHDVGQADVWFQVVDGMGASHGGLTRLDTSSDPGIIVFENLMSGPNLVSRQDRHVEGRVSIYCSTDDGETILAQVSGPAGESLSLEIPEDKHVVCDWYTIPDSCSSFGRPCNEESDCCPGERCSARGTCGTCDTDADCVGDFSCCPELNPVCEPLCGQPDSR